ncbi:hypothetical protein AAE478_001690 [Parahypoxylon ruwenzoriense]
MLEDLVATKEELERTGVHPEKKSIPEPQPPSPQAQYANPALPGHDTLQQNGPIASASMHLLE